MATAEMIVKTVAPKPKTWYGFEKSGVSRDISGINDEVASGVTPTECCLFPKVVREGFRHVTISTSVSHSLCGRRNRNAPQPSSGSLSRSMIERMQSSPLLSVRRLLFTYGVAFLISLSDMFLIQFLGINTATELMTQTLIHGTGFYLGFTLIALFDTSPRR
ncbi:hypothetical protein ACFQE1_02435 [Halobium palmae]|uniref:Uncharacterized protein n=1 Tax=Halobium palmae TaxID=1776492 RepID=A0ABD5RWF0_9EURY